MGRANLDMLYTSGMGKRGRGGGGGRWREWKKGSGGGRGVQEGYGQIEDGRVG